MRPSPARRTAFLIVAVAVVLSACEPDAAPELHDLTVTGAIDQRVTWLYGAPRAFTLEGVERELTTPSEDLTVDPWAVPDALWIDGAPALTQDVEGGPAPVEVSRIPLTTDLQVRTRRETRALLYYDGSAWLELGTFDPAGLNVRVTPRPRLGGLRGLGELTAPEAAALRGVLEDLGGPLIVAVLTGDDVPRRAVDGTAEQRSTAVHVVAGVETDTSAFRPTPRDVPFEVVASGSQAAGVEGAEYRMLTTREALTRAWNQAYGTSLTVPPLPSVDLERETLVAIFLGTQPTGGYGLEVETVTVEGGDLYVDVVETSPAADAIATQALTNPWVLLRVPRGDVDAVWFRDAEDGRLLAVARRDD